MATCELATCELATRELATIGDRLKTMSHQPRSRQRQTVSLPWKTLPKLKSRPNTPWVVLCLRSQAANRCELIVVDLSGV